MTRTKLVAATVAVAAAVTLAPNAAAQDTGAPQHIGQTPSSSSEYLSTNVGRLFSPDKYERQNGSTNLQLFPAFSAYSFLYHAFKLLAR